MDPNQSEIKGQFYSRSRTMKPNHFDYGYEFGLEPTHAHSLYE